MAPKKEGVVKEEEKLPPTTVLDPTKLKRTKPPEKAPPPDEDSPVAATSLGATVVELAFNPTRDKIREVTIIDRMQGRLLPQLDLVTMSWQYVHEIALFRMDSEAYTVKYQKPRPTPPDLHGEFTYRTAQWQKSVAGKNLERATDIALAEIETQGDKEEDYSGSSEPWKD